MRPGTDLWKQLLLESPILENRLLGDTIIIPDNEDSDSHYDPFSSFKNLTKHGVFDAGTHAQLTGYLAPWQLDYGRWHRSKETLAGKYPYSGYLTNKKKWPLKIYKRLPLTPQMSKKKFFRKSKTQKIGEKRGET